jgi:hypothetical protein
MFLVPGFVVSAVTFPGVIVHEAAHRFFCDLGRVPVYNVCYFRFGNPAGYVVHGPTERLRTNFLIAIGPLIVNTILCAIISFTAITAFIVGDANMSPIFLPLLWLGLSIGMHAFPSKTDVQNFSAAVRASGRGSLVYAGAKAVEYVIRAANALSVVWFDAVYAVAVAMTLPLLVYLVFA